MISMPGKNKIYIENICFNSKKYFFGNICLDIHWLDLLFEWRYLYVKYYIIDIHF